LAPVASCAASGHMDEIDVEASISVTKFGAAFSRLTRQW
jgi:hypothetical protein